MRPKLGALSALAAIWCATPALASETIHIAIDKLAFSPAHASAHVGDTIEWVSSDFIAHTATARDKQWDVAIPANGSARVTLQRAGDIDYFCRFHPNMTGRISVVPGLP